MKIVCLGLFRTGTTSLQSAMEILGYTGGQGGLCNHPTLDEDVCKTWMRAEAPVCDFRRGFPWVIYPQWLADTYPDVKFIYTWRSPRAWLASAAACWPRARVRMHEWFFNTETPGVLDNEDAYHNKYLEHSIDVYDAFRNQPERLLRMNIVDREDGWDELCPFLGVPAPDVPFPYTGKITCTHT